MPSNRKRDWTIERNDCERSGNIGALRIASRLLLMDCLNRLLLPDRSCSIIGHDDKDKVESFFADALIAITVPFISTLDRTILSCTHIGHRHPPSDLAIRELS
jgi:hypothetical protein